MESIGNRAYAEIQKRANANGIKIYKEAEKMDIHSSSISGWKTYMNPCAYHLQQMYLAGYDVIYILTGKRPFWKANFTNGKELSMGERAYAAIKARAQEKGISFAEECQLLGTSKVTIACGKRKKSNSGSWLIAEMYRQGYDIGWVLTGEE